eukprot:NODE_11840_length_1262_cov_5.464317.p1 GENE.NODE_11840_length_1262_cov_5.464317~~NODE_11840_length_1262_cov_5.464317.p1  ORF type:complete len:250 (+),score=43.41 NODE_11840_length_1262_cov_5.464317:309-1058(+)
MACDLLEADCWHVREAAARALPAVTECGDERVVGALLTHLQTDTKAAVREVVAHALARVTERDDPRAVRALAKSLLDENWRVGEAAAGALGTVAERGGDIGPAAISALNRCRWTSHWCVRAAIGRALDEVLAQKKKSNTTTNVRAWAGGGAPARQAAVTSNASPAYGPAPPTLVCSVAAARCERGSGVGGSDNGGGGRVRAVVAGMTAAVRRAVTARRVVGQCPLLLRWPLLWPDSLLRFTEGPPPISA